MHIANGIKWKLQIARAIKIERDGVCVFGSLAKHKAVKRTTTTKNESSKISKTFVLLRWIFICLSVRLFVCSSVCLSISQSHAHCVYFRLCVCVCAAIILFHDVSMCIIFRIVTMQFDASISSIMSGEYSKRPIEMFPKMDIFCGGEYINANNNPRYEPSNSSSIERNPSWSQYEHYCMDIVTNDPHRLSLCLYHCTVYSVHVTWQHQVIRGDFFHIIASNSIWFVP